MSSLKRYRKTGGFVQLLSLIETFGAQKKSKFIDMIDAEDKGWAKLLSEKMLTVERIYSWPDQVVIEILKHMQVNQLTWVIEGMDQATKDRFLPFFSASERRRFEDVVAEQKNPRPEDVSGNQVRMIELTRKLLLEGTLRPEKYDAGVLIPEGIEAKLDEQQTKRQAGGEPSLDGHVYGADEVSVDEDVHNGEASSSNAEVLALKKTINILVKKNQQLAAELRVLRDKLEQIRRVA